MAVWIIARIWRGLDCVTSMNSDWDEKFAKTSFYPLYVGPLYLFAELLPISSLLFGKIIETLDHGTTEYKLFHVPTAPNYAKSHPSSKLSESLPNMLADGDRQSEDEQDMYSAVSSYTGEIKDMRDGKKIHGSPPNAGDTTASPGRKYSSGGARTSEAINLLDSVRKNPGLKNFIIPYNELHIVERIGGGAGGIVMKAVW